jgi:hypothetical protein
MAAFFMSSPIGKYASSIFYPEPLFESLVKHEAYFRVESIAQKTFTKAKLPDSFMESLDGTVVSSVCQKRTYSLPILNYQFYPTDLGLEIIAQHYKMKYDFKVFISNSASLVEQAFLAFKEDPSLKIWGVISTSSSTLHVTPFLCMINKEGALEITSLDSCLTITQEASVATHKLKDQEVPYFLFFPQNRRQIDSFSCRTDAICILKEVFLTLQKEKVDSLKGYLESFKIEGSIHEYFFIPGIWLKGAQLKEAILEDPSKVILAQKKEPLDAFLRRYQIVSMKTDQLAVGIKNTKGCHQSVYFEVKELKINLFLYLKAIKYAALIKETLGE